MEYYLALKKKTTLPFVATCMNLEDMMLSEISQTQKDKYCMKPLFEVSKVVKLIETEIRRVVVRGWGRGKWGTQIWVCKRVSPKIYCTA